MTTKRAPGAADAPAPTAASPPLTLFRWGYEGWGSSIPQLLEVTSAVEEARGFAPPVFVDVRFSRSVRAVGFRDRALERTLGPDRYVWMQSLGNAAIGRHDGTIAIHDPAGAELLLDRAAALHAGRRRVIFFCSCGPPTHCHRNEVARLLLASARRRSLAVEVVEWPGGEPTGEMVAEVRVTSAVLRPILRGAASVPLGAEDCAARLAGLPVGSIVAVTDGAARVSVSVQPATYRAGGWSLPIFTAPGEDGEDGERLLAEVMARRQERRFAARR